MLHLLETSAADQPAILAPGRAAHTYGALHALCEETITRLNALGVGPGDRVAIVLPNGPEMATAFMAVASAAASAPLNPGYRAEEFEFYLTDLNARALLVEQGSESPAIEVAQRLGVPVIRLTGLPTPTIDTALALVGQRARQAGCYAGHSTTRNP